MVLLEAQGSEDILQVELLATLELLEPLEHLDTPQAPAPTPQVQLVNLDIPRPTNLPPMVLESLDQALLESLELHKSPATLPALDQEAAMSEVPLMEQATLLPTAADQAQVELLVVSLMELQVPLEQVPLMELLTPAVLEAHQAATRHQPADMELVE